MIRPLNTFSYYESIDWLKHQPQDWIILLCLFTVYLVSAYLQFHAGIICQVESERQAAGLRPLSAHWNIGKGVAQFGIGRALSLIVPLAKFIEAFKLIYYFLKTPQKTLFPAYK